MLESSDLQNGVWIFLRICQNFLGIQIQISWEAWTSHLQSLYVLINLPGRKFKAFHFFSLTLGIALSVKDPGTPDTQYIQHVGLDVEKVYSAQKLNKQGDSIQPFPVLNQSVVLCLALTVASWPVYRFFRRQVRWFGIPISVRSFQNLLWSTQSKAVA